MKIFYFNLNINRFPKTIKDDFKIEREIMYLNGKNYDIPLVVIKTDSNIVEDIITNDTYSLEDNDYLLNGIITREINYEEYSNLLSKINDNDKEYYKNYMNKLHNILIEKENIKEEKEIKKNKERILII